MPTGRVKWFNDARGFGFIVNEAGGPEVFVHYTGIAGGGHRSLHEDARVTFELREGSDAIHATDDPELLPQVHELAVEAHEHAGGFHKLEWHKLVVESEPHAPVKPD